MSPRNVSVSLLLPPSEGKAEGGDPAAPWDPATARASRATDTGTGNGNDTGIAAHRTRLAALLQAAGGGDERLLGVRAGLLHRARAANAGLVGAPTLPAYRRYTGVVWDALDVASMSSATRRRAASSVLVVSGLLGVVWFDEPVPDYRLKMGARLAPLGLLSTWWRPVVSQAIAERTARRFVVDLLPQEHRAAWQPAPGARGVSVSFVERAGSRAGRAVGHDAKAAKGRLARHLLDAPGHPLDALASWSDDRFALVTTDLG